MLAFDLARPVEEALLHRLQLPAVPVVLAAGDLGLDGQAEVAVVTVDAQLVVVRMDGATQVLQLADTEATCLRFLSDGSGLVVGFQSSLRLACFVPDEDGRLGPAARRVQLDGIPRDMEEIDLDADGDLELVVAGGDRDLWVFGFGERSPLRTECEIGYSEPLRWEIGSIPLDLEVADVDRDGEPELLVLHFYELNVGVLDDFTFAGPGSCTSEPMGQTPWDCAVADLNADGVLDLVTSNRDAYRISLLLGAEGGFRREQRAAVGRAPRSVAAGDLDGDGLPEVLAVNSVAGDLSVLANAEGALSEVARIPLPGDAAAVCCGDVDGDGHVDAAVLVRDSEAAGLALFRGDGTAALESRSGAPEHLGDSMGDLVLCDLDTDGRLEAVATDPVGGNVVIYRGSVASDRTFALKRWAALRVEGEPHGLAVFPREAGGAPVRLVVALAEPPGLRGALVLELEQPPDATLPRLRVVERLPTEDSAFDAQAGDVDGDGREDLVLLTRGRNGHAPGHVHVWLATDDGGWQRLEPLETGHRPFRIATGDLDGDGRADILASSQHSHHVNVWLPRGAGESVHWVRWPDLGVGSGPLGITLADVQGDGRLDVVVAHHFDDSVGVVLNESRR